MAGSLCVSEEGRLSRRELFVLWAFPLLAFVTLAVCSDAAKLTVSIEGDGRKEELSVHHYALMDGWCRNSNPIDPNLTMNATPLLTYLSWSIVHSLVTGGLTPSNVFQVAALLLHIPNDLHNAAAVCICPECKGSP